ncbi:MAG: hypothetical protein IIA14_08335 [SAR324 cluster bacterium]|nr:hypothetical protein [SAR324 cluster bacterium]
MTSRLGIDVGGTFTDLLLFNDETRELHLLKTPSTPHDQSEGILTGIERIIQQSGIPASEIASLLHGTTVSTNIVLEQKGAKVGLLVTQNFEQVLHLARSQTPGPLAGWMIMIKPDPLADLEVTHGIVERINARGEILKPLDEEHARPEGDELLDLDRAPVLRLAELQADPHIKSRTVFEEVDHAEVGPRMYPRLPLTIDGEPLLTARGTPLFAQHNREVFSGLLGMPEETLAEWANADVIGDLPEGALAR